MAGSPTHRFLKISWFEAAVFFCFNRPKMKALAYFTAEVEEPPSLALPFKTIRQYIQSDSIVLEGDDGEEYSARLFRRSRSSEKIYVASGWRKFEHAHGIGEGDVLFCKLLPGPKLKIQVAEKNGGQNSDHLSDDSSIGKSYKKRKMDQYTCSKKKGSDSDSECFIFEKSRKVRKTSCTRKVGRPRKTQDQQYSNKKKETPGSWARKELHARIQAFESKIHHPYHVMELTTKKMNQKGAVPMDFAMHVNAANGSSVKLVAEGHKHKVNWINFRRFQGFGKGWIDFLEFHNLKLGDYIVLENPGEKTIRIHLFHQSANQGKQEEMSCAYKCKSEPCTSFKGNLRTREA